MADWYGTARTNYVRFANVDGLVEALKPFPLSLSRHPNGVHIALDTTDHFGGWPSFVLDQEDKEIEFDFAEHVAPFMEPGQVLVTVECGAEKLRYLTGVSNAYHWDGSKVKKCSVSMDDIYKKAAKKFAVDASKIAEASYQYVAEDEGGDKCAR